MWLVGKNSRGRAYRTLYCGTMMEVFNFGGKANRGMESENMSRRSTGVSWAAVRIRSGGMALFPGLLYGLTHFITAMMLATPNEIEDNGAKCRTGWIFECHILSLTKAENKFLLSTPSKSAGDSRRMVLRPWSPELPRTWAANELREWGKNSELGRLT